MANGALELLTIHTVSCLCSGIFSTQTPLVTTIWGYSSVLTALLTLLEDAFLLNFTAMLPDH